MREYVVVEGNVRYTGGFLQPVMVSVPYPDVNNTGIVDGTKVPAASLALYTLNEQTGVWEAVSGSQVDTTLKIVTAPAPHLSVFTALGASDPAVSSLNAVRVYPNPWRPGSGGNHDAGGVTFDGLTADATIRIYTMTGRLVRQFDKPDTSLSAQVVWDGNDESGRAVASGVFYYVVTDSAGLKTTGRVAVIR